jgi:hypothetical protein
MRAKFIRGESSREKIIDKLLDRIITVELPTYDVELKNGMLDTRHENTKDFVDELDKAGVSYKVTGEDDTYVYIELSGTKNQLIEVFPLWDASGRDSDELAEVLADWDGNPEKIHDEIF